MSVFLLIIFFVTIVSLIKHSVAYNNIYSEPQQQYFEITRPLPFADLPPSCTSHILTHEFGDTKGLSPVSASYSPPANCSWTHVALQFNASSYKGAVYDGSIAAVWLDGVELLRTSTVHQPGIFWTVNKDVTRYSSVLVNHNISLSVMLENQVNYGAYQVNISFMYYSVEKTDVSSDSSQKLKLETDVSSDSNRKLKLKEDISSDSNSKLELISDVFVNGTLRSEYEKPADLIIPISRNRSSGGGFWFTILDKSDLHGQSVIIPKNTYKAVIEIYVSAHGYDEFWYTNPPDSYIQMNNLNTKRGHGAYREVLVNLDHNLVGSVVPFPVIYPAGIDPAYWKPLVSIGAFDHPSYEIDLSPYLGILLDGESHFIGLGVNNSIPFWLVDANLHLWVDNNCVFPCQVQAKPPDVDKSKFNFELSSNFDGLDGSFEVEVKRESKISFWMSSSAGSFTTTIERELKFKNKIKFHQNGTKSKIKQKVKEEIEVEVSSDSGNTISKTKVKRKFPLTITSKTSASRKSDATLVVSDLDNEWKEKKKLKGEVDFSSKLKNRQQCNAWMVVQDRNVLLAGATTEQSYSYSDDADSYSRNIVADNGKLTSDTTSSLYGAASLRTGSYSAL